MRVLSVCIEERITGKKRVRLNCVDKKALSTRRTSLKKFGKRSNIHHSNMHHKTNILDGIFLVDCCQQNSSQLIFALISERKPIAKSIKLVDSTIYHYQIAILQPFQHLSIFFIEIIAYFGLVILNSLQPIVSNDIYLFVVKTLSKPYK